MGFSPIQNAKNTLLNQNPGTLPNLSDAVTQWFQPLTFVKVEKKTVNFQLVEAQTEVQTMGIKQQFGPRQLSMKPQGQRKWNWLMVHAVPGTALEIDDIVVQINLQSYNTPYRVESKLDYSEYGYIEYHLHQDYDESNGN